MRSQSRYVGLKNGYLTLTCSNFAFVAADGGDWLHVQSHDGVQLHSKPSSSDANAHYFIGDDVTNAFNGSGRP